MIKKTFFILLINGLIFPLRAMEPAEKALADQANPIVAAYMKEAIIKPRVEAAISFLHALQNGKLSLQKKEAFFVFSHFILKQKIYNYPINEVCEKFCENKNNKENLITLFPTNLLDDKTQPYLDAYAHFLRNIDLLDKQLSLEEIETITNNREKLLNALASKDVNTIETALKLPVQPKIEKKPNWLAFVCPVI